MRKFIYIKVHKGFIEARTVGEGNEKKFISKGLSHPRSLADDFDQVQKTFREAISVQPKKFFGLLKPIGLVHLIPEAEGGYTEVERRFFKEVAIGSGLSEIYLLENNLGPLQDSELIDIKKNMYIAS